jgi:hypothetical protein
MADEGGKMAEFMQDFIAGNPGLWNEDVGETD